MNVMFSIWKFKISVETKTAQRMHSLVAKIGCAPISMFEIFTRLLESISVEMVCVQPKPLDLLLREQSTSLL